MRVCAIVLCLCGLALSASAQSMLTTYDYEHEGPGWFAYKPSTVGGLIGGAVVIGAGIFAATKYGKGKDDEDSGDDGTRLG
jgi:uncharacterized membrane protein YedE/YeeE